MVWQRINIYSVYIYTYYENHLVYLVIIQHLKIWLIFLSSCFQWRFLVLPGDMGNTGVVTSYDGLLRRTLGTRSQTLRKQLRSLSRQQVVTLTSCAGPRYNDHQPFIVGLGGGWCLCGWKPNWRGWALPGMGPSWPLLSTGQDVPPRFIGWKFQDSSGTTNLETAGRRCEM